MTTDLTLRPIAHIRSVFPSKFGIPRQSGLTETLRSEIVFEEAFRSPQALRGLSDFSHLWIIWGFSENVESGLLRSDLPAWAEISEWESLLPDRPSDPTP